MKKQMQNQKGFTLIELMIVVAIIGILAAVALPAYSDYTKRAKMSEVMGFAASAKTAVSECLLDQGADTLCDTNTEAGLAAAADIDSTYVESVTVGTGAAITVAIQGFSDTTLDAASVVLTPSVTSGGVEWACTISDSDIAKYMPSSCRTETST